MRTHATVSVFIVGVIVAAAASAATPLRYFATPLEVAGSPASWAGSVSLNDRGDIVGHLFSGPVATPTYQTKQVALWTRAGSPTQLASHVLPMPADATETFGMGATDLSDDGRIVAQFTSVGSTTASMWTWTPATPNAVTGNWAFVPPVGGAVSWRYDAAINSAGVVAGVTANGAVTRLNPQSGGGWAPETLDTFGGFTTARDLTDSGRIVGTASDLAGGQRAYISRPLGEGSGILDLGAFASDQTLTDAIAVSNSGNAIVGTGRPSVGGPTVNIRWTPVSSDPDNDAFTALQIAPPAGYASGGHPQDVNDQGEFVGGFFHRDLPPYPYVWTQQTGYRNLNELLESTSGAGFDIRSVHSINNAGQVLVEAWLTTEPGPPIAPPVRRSLLLTPGVAGDTNFDFSVNFQDLLMVAQHFGLNTGQTWSTGDFDGDGGVGFDDLLALSQNYGESTLADWALAHAMVPEPTIALLFAPLAVSRRRR